jgi:tetratricopeptide (TPR) repeat protein
LPKRIKRQAAHHCLLSGLMSKPPRPASERPGTNHQALEQAGLALRRQQPDEAERLSAGVLKADRGNIAAAQLLATALLLQGRAEEAIGPLQRAARRSRDPAIETLLARSLAAVGRTDDALDRLRLATERRPPYPPAFLELGVGLSDLGRVDEGAAVLEGGLALMPDADGLRLGLGYLHLKRNDRSSARQTFQKVHAAAPGRPDAMVGLAQVLALDGEYSAAADLYRRAIALRPDDAAMRVGLGKCLLEMGQRVAGETTIRAAAGGSAALAGKAITALAATPHGRLFLRPSAAAKFLGVKAE